MKVSDVRVMGRATQGVRLINLDKRGDEIASVCKVPSSEELEDEIETVEVADNSETAEMQNQSSKESTEITENNID